MYHTIIIVGNLGRDPEMRYTPNGQAVTNLNVATSRQYTDTAGQQVKETIPGDTLRYTIHYINEGKSEALSAVIVDPVPADTVYIGNSAEGKGSEITFSIDGKTFEAPIMLTYTVKHADGTETKHAATPEMYTHIKWKLSKPVTKGGSGTVSFIVKVK